MKKLSFILYLKQGIKSVFKFRIQFFVIVILTFLSTSILTISLSTTARLNSEYENTLNKIEKFDYVNQKAVGQTSEGEESTILTPLMDLINDEFLATYNSKDINDINSNFSIEYNFNLSDFDSKYLNLGYKQTFLTKAFNDNEVLTAFYNMLKDSTYYTNEQNFIFLPNLTYRDNSRYESTFQIFQDTLINKMKEYFLDDLFLENGNTEKYLEKSLFAILKQKKLITIDDFSNNQIFDNSDLNQYNRYLYFALQSVSLQINWLIFDYINYWVNLATFYFNQQSEFSDIEDYFNQKWYSQAGFKWFSSSPSNTDSLEFASTLFIYILGKPYNNQTNLNDKQKAMVVSDQNKPWANKIDMSLEYSQPIVLNSKDDLYKFGARGSLSQLYVNLENNNKYESIAQKTNTLTFLTYQSQNPFISEIGLNSNFQSLVEKEKINFWDVSVEKIYFLRNKLIGQAFDLNYIPRAEVSFQDNTTQINYRIVVMDSYWKEKITVYQGYMPRNNNEILINPQFARENNYELGDNISIGGANLVISGFGSDPYTYFPVVDTQIPIPNNKKNAIIFASNDIIANQIMNDDFKKYATNYIYNFLTSKTNENIEESLVKFLSYSFTNQKELLSDYNFIYSNQANSNAYNKSMFRDNYYSFENSLLSLNWKVTPFVLKIFNIFTFTASALICFIAFIAAIIGIKKTIYLNSGEIAILKSLGVKNCEISLSYLSYSLIVLLFVIPLGWVFGSLMQEFISRLFLEYIGGSSNLISFNFLPFIISILIFGLSLCLISFLTSYFLIKKPIYEITNSLNLYTKTKIIKKITRKITKKTKFSIRFSTELATTSFSKTCSTAITLFFAGFLVSTALAIPGIVDNFISSYNKNINYLNDSQNLDLIGNAPLAKTALSPTKEVDYYSNYLIDSNNIFGSNIKKVATSVSQFAPSPDTSKIPSVLISPNNENDFSVDWVYDKFLSEDSKNVDDSFVSSLMSVLGNNTIQLVGSGLSISDIQKFIEWIIHSTNKEYINNFSQRLEKINQVANLLTQGLPNLINQFFASDLNLSGYWKEQIMSIVLSRAPLYLKNYLSIDENRLNNFEFGWQTNKYIPGVDNLYTSLDILSKNNQNLKTIGLDSKQNAYNIDQNSKSNLFFSDYQAQILKKIMYGEKVSQNDLNLISSIYNPSSKELSIPVVTNEQTEYDIENNWDYLNNLNINVKRFVLKNNSLNIPNDAWMYDDRDWLKYQNKLNSNKQFLTMSGLQNSKFTHAPIFSYLNNDKQENDFYRYKYSKLKDNAYAFYNLTSTIDKNGKEDLNLEIRPYYSYNNVVLFIPKIYATDFEYIKNLGNTDSTSWWDENNVKDYVPQKTIDAWNGVDNSINETSDFIAIRPYSYYFDKRATYQTELENLSGNTVDGISQKYKNFLAESMSQPNGPLAVSDVDMNWNNISKQNVNKISFKKVGEIGVYGTSLLIADQNLVNLISGFGIDKYIPFNLQYEDFNSSNNSSYTINEVEINTYDKLNPIDILKITDKNEWVFGDDLIQKSYHPNMWYNGVYSNADEPYFITTQFSFGKSTKIGEHTLDASTYFNDTTEIKNANFLSQKKALISQVSNLLLTIGILFISLFILIMILTVILISDLYVNQYKQFMIVMKTLGYSNGEIIFYTFGFVTIFSLFAYVIGVAISYLAIFTAIKIVISIVGVIPFGMTWWSPLVAATLVFIAYFISIIITTKKIRTQSPSSLVDWNKI